MILNPVCCSSRTNLAVRSFKLLNSSRKRLYSYICKITYLNHVVEYPLKKQKKGFHVEHGFCLQSRIGGIICCVDYRRQQDRLLEHRVKFKAVHYRLNHCEEGSHWVRLNDLLCNFTPFVNSCPMNESRPDGGVYNLMRVA